jgi:hypothetical protein
MPEMTAPQSAFLGTWCLQALQGGWQVAAAAGRLQLSAAGCSIYDNWIIDVHDLKSFLTPEG